MRAQHERLRPAQWRPAAAALFLASAGLAVVDAASEEPPDVASFPEAVVVATSETELRAYEFVTGRVERSRRERRVERSARVPAKLLRATYRTPPGTRLEDVAQHYRGQVADLTEVFSCQGLDCGRSTVWANDVFGVKELVAPDSAQFYLAAAGGDTLVAVYIVRRGNRRVYAHVDFARGDGIGARVLGGKAVNRGTNVERSVPAGLAETLRRDRYAVLADVVPDRAGGLGRTALRALDTAAAQLVALDDQVFVVCHVDGDGDMDAAIALSSDCAEQAAQRLQAAGLAAAPFGAGPLLPRAHAPRRRVELVLP